MAKFAKINGCIGCGACTAICPEVFEINGDGIAENIFGEDAEIAEDLETSVEEAASACPVSAITVE